MNGGISLKFGLLPCNANRFMLKLTLRPEFRDTRLKGTMIELTNGTHTGAIETSAASFLEITYPSVDLIKCIEGIAPGEGRPIVLMGGRGQGKSHIIAACHHVLASPDSAKHWLDEWAQHLGNSHLSQIKLRQGFRVITEQLHNQKYPNLWDMLFDRASKGAYFRGKFEQSGTSVPSKDLVLEMISEEPLAILLDEYQTWFDGLPNNKQQPKRTWAFNFIQVLSEIAAELPDRLLLIASVRDGASDAYQQIHRLNPRMIDFSDPLTKRDRHRLLLHRIFANRRQIAPNEIEQLTELHFAEYLRLKEVPGAESTIRRARFQECWPFSPQLLDLLDDQVLMAAQAQETRDLIRLLVETFKCAGDRVPVLTAADFRIDTDQSAAPTLLNAVASELHRRIQEKARRNLENVVSTNRPEDVPHAAEIISALWLRSFNTERLAGSTYADLQLDITRAAAIDDNLFAVEIQRIKETSFNIHDQGPSRIVFRDEENPDARLLAHARNDKLFQDDQRDLHFLRKFTHALIAGDDQSPYRVIALPQFWQTNPWAKMDPEESPTQWDNRTPIIVVPETSDDENAALGEWLKTNLTTKRNTPRFLLLKKGFTSIYRDRDIIVQARAALLAKEWQAEGGDYRQLKAKYDRLLTEALKDRFDRFAVLDRWNFAEPAKCRFHIVGHSKQGKAIPAAIQEVIRSTLFIPEDFEKFVVDFADSGDSVRKLLDELAEPRAGGAECIIWLGEVDIIERIEALAAQGSVSINLRGTQLLQRQAGETESAALHRIRGKIGTGSHLNQTTIHKPQAAGAAGGGIAGGTPVPGPTGSSMGSEGTGALPGISGAGTSPSPVGPAGGQPPVNPPPANPFGAEQIQTIRKTSPRTSALNLTGELERWAVTGNVQVRNVTLSIGDITGDKLAALLRRLPDGTYAVELDKDA
jgi:hypothetical protein